MMPWVKEGKFRGKNPYWMLMNSGIETNKVSPLTSTSLSYRYMLATRLLAYKPRCASHYYRSSSFVFFAALAIISHTRPLIHFASFAAFGTRRRTNGYATQHIKAQNSWWKMVRNALQYTYVVDEWIVEAHNAHQCFGYVSTTSRKLHFSLVICLGSTSSSHLIKYVDIRLFRTAKCVLSLDERENILVSCCA